MRSGPDGLATTRETTHQLSLLSHLRWAAALLVAISHIRVNTFIDYESGSLPIRAFYFITGFGHQAVVIFFVLSGFLVGRKLFALCEENDPHWGEYLLDRFARVFVVLIPALLASAAFFAAALLIAPQLAAWSPAVQGTLRSDLNFTRWLAAASLTNGLTAPTLTVNGPLWSLAYEWSYYVAGLVAVFAFKRIITRSTLIITIYAVALIAIAAVKQPDLLIGGISWIFGALGSKAFERNWISGRAFLPSSLVAISVFLFSRIAHVPDPILGASIAIAISNKSGSQVKFMPALAAGFSSFSYALYAIHFPATVMLAACLYRWNSGHRLALSPASLTLFVGEVGASLLFAWLFSRQTETRTPEFRNAVTQTLSRLRAATTGKPKGTPLPKPRHASTTSTVRSEGVRD